ncbi:MAG TPA: hypothetical protein VMT15_02905 [Bryobacteraceae bacterium]|nr:hypothetical protein [Bryobacteraceae bacterium]
MSKATYDDVNLILRLYEIRREEKLRAARVWFVTNFKVKTVAEMSALAAPGSEANAYFRQSTSYWDMVAGFITAGVLDQELFFESGRELLLFWLRLKPIAAEYRQVTKSTKAWSNMETVANAFAEHMGREAFDAFAARVAG